jgi:biopolymer transport protein ExbB/TolQ
VCGHSSGMAITRPSSPISGKVVHDPLPINLSRPKWSYDGILTQPDPTYAKQALESTERAMSRSALAVHGDLKRGLSALATVTCLAPLMGILETILWGIPNWFPALGTEKTYAMAMICNRLAHSLIPTAFGLLIGLQSLWCYKYFRGRLEDFDCEMKNTALQLLNELRPHFGQLRFSPPEDSDQFQCGTGSPQT